MARKTPLTATRIEAAEICGLSPRQFDDAIRSRAKDATVGKGAALRYRLRPIVEALVEYRVELSERQIRSSIDIDGDVQAGPMSSEALERLRTANARLREMDLAERNGALVRLHVIADALRPAMVAMRSTGDRLTRKFGNDAGEIFNEGIADFEAAAAQVIAGSDVHAAANATIAPAPLDRRADAPARDGARDAKPAGPRPRRIRRK